MYGAPKSYLHEKKHTYKTHFHMCMENKMKEDNKQQKQPKNLFEN